MGVGARKIIARVPIPPKNRHCIVGLERSAAAAEAARASGRDLPDYLRTCEPELASLGKDLHHAAECPCSIEGRGLGSADDFHSVDSVGVDRYNERRVSHLDAVDE